MTQSLDLDTGNKIQFQIENTTSKPIPIILKVKKRIQMVDGKEELPETNDFNIIPPQVIVPPKDKRAVRLKYIGPKELKQERSYRVIAEQVPLDLDDKKKSSGIKMLLKYQAALYVSSKKFKSDVSVSESKLEKDKLIVKLINEGPAHQYLQNFSLKFVGKNKTIELSKKQLSPLIGQNILSKSQRVFKLDRIKGLDNTYKGKIKFND